MNSARALRWNTYAHIFLHRRKLQRPSQKFSRRLGSSAPAALAALAAIFFALANAGTAGAQTQAPPQRLFALTSTQTSPGVNSLSVTTYQVDPTTGALTAIAAPPALLNTALFSAAVNPAQTFLFGTSLNSSGNGVIVVLSIAADGSTTVLPASPFGVLSNPAADPLYLAVSPDGKYLFVVSEVVPQTSAPSTILDTFTIGADGIPALLETHTLAPGRPSGLYLHPTGKWLYVLTYYSPGPPDSGDPAVIQQYDLNADGTLTVDLATPLEDYSNPGLMLGGSPNGVFVFAGYTMAFTAGNTSFLDSFLVNSVTGNLTEVSSHEFQAEQQVGTANTAAVDSTSNYVYNTVTGFTFVNGVLAPVSTIPTPTGATVEGVLASPDTPFLFVQISTTGLSSDLVNGDGSLTPAATSVSGGALVVTGAIPVPNQPYLQVNPTADINFSVVVGKVQTIPININNWGFGPLTIDSITIAGDPSLTISNTCTAPIPPSGTCIPVVTYAPTIAGPASAVVTIVSNSPIAATQTVTIGASSIEPFSDPVLIPSQQILIPDTAQGSSSTLAIQLQNATNASAPLTVSGITWTGTNPNDFSQTNNCTGQIAVGASCTINIIFTPQALGNRAAILNIANNSPDGPVAAMVSGNGVTTVTKWTFNASAVGPGTITQTPPGTSFPNNTTLYLTTAPNANSSFVNWSTGCPMNEGLVPCTVVLTQNTTITAQFEANVTLTTSVVGPGTITQAPAGTSFRPGDSVVLTAVPNTGAQFSGWTPASVCILGNAPPTQCFITLNANTAVTATFTGGAQVSLTTNVSGPGTIMQSPAGTSFASGTSITLTAVPGAGAIFDSWSGACAGSTNPVCTFIISANTTVSAMFTQQFTLSTSASGPGTIQQSPTGTVFNSGTSITLTAVPNSGATFTSWAGACAGSTTAVCTFAISANTAATATFTANPAVTVPQPTQMGTPGTAFTFPLSTAGFANPPTLTAACSIPEGSCTVSGTTLTVTTTAPSANAVRVAAAGLFSGANGTRGSNPTLTLTPAPSPVRLTAVRPMFLLVALLSLLMLLAGPTSFAPAQRARKLLRPALLIAGLVLLAACGGGGGGGTPPITGTPAGTYKVTITATSGAQTAMTVVSVVVE